MSRAAPAGSASAVAIGTIRAGATWVRTATRSVSSGESAEATLTAPARAASAPSAGGSQSPRRTSHSSRCGRWTPTRQGAVSLRAGKKSRQSLMTSQTPSAARRPARWKG